MRRARAASASAPSAGRSRRRPTPATSSRRRTARRRQRRLAGGHLPVEPVLAEQRPAPSSPRPPATRRSASPSSSSSTRRVGPLEDPVGTLKDVAGRPAGRAQRQPAGHAPVRPRDLHSQRARLPAQLGRRGEHRHHRARRRRRSAGLRPGLQPRPQPGRTGAVRLQRRSARTSSSKPTSNGAATTTRASRSPSRRPRPAWILKNRLVFTGVAGNGTFLTTPSTCHDPAQAAFAHTYSTYLRADSVEVPTPPSPTAPSRFEAALPPGVKPTGCALVPFKPGIGGRRRAPTAPTRPPAPRSMSPFPSNRCCRSPTPTCARRGPRCRSAWASTPPPPKGSPPAPTPSSARAPGTRSPARPRRRSARSRSKPRRCRPAR